MGVSVEEPGKDVASFEVDDLGSRRRGSGADGSDLPATQEDGRVPRDLPRANVEHVRMEERDLGLRLRLRERQQ
jgi:hypothetical protein